jgi:hypothetical protein
MKKGKKTSTMRSDSLPGPIIYGLSSALGWAESKRRLSGQSWASDTVYQVHL